MLIGLGIGLPFASAISLAAQIAALFAAGEQGAWYDPSDFSTMFQDSAGTTPVTAVGQPVGKLLDKSGRGNHATQATSTKRPLLQQDAAGRYYLAFDGVDDALATGSINFTATDKMTVVAGVRKLSDAARGGVLRLLAADVGEFRISAPSAAGSPSISFRSNGTVAVATNATVSAPSTAVVTGIGGISPAIVMIRINGVVMGSSQSSQGTGMYSNAPLTIGSEDASVNYFNGRIYSLIVRGAQSTDAQIAAAEAYCNQRTGAY